jgi:hypothetical protein
VNSGIVQKKHPTSVLRVSFTGTVLITSDIYIVAYLYAYSIISSPKGKEFSVQFNTPVPIVAVLSSPSHDALKSSLPSVRFFNISHLLS